MPKNQQRDHVGLAQKVNELTVMLKDGKTKTINSTLDTEAIGVILEDAENCAIKNDLQVHPHYLPMELGQIYIAKAKNGKIEAAKKNKIKFCGKKQNKSRGKVFKVETESVRIGTESVVLWKYGITSDYHLIQCRRKKGVNSLDTSDSERLSSPLQPEPTPPSLPPQVAPHILYPDHNMNYGTQTTTLNESQHLTLPTGPAAPIMMSPTSSSLPLELGQWKGETEPFWGDQEGIIYSQSSTPHSTLPPTVIHQTTSALNPLAPSSHEFDNNTHNFIQLPPLNSLKTSSRFSFANV